MLRCYAMDEKISRVLLTIEALILCLPLSILFIIKIIPATIYFLGDEIYEPAYITMAVNLLILIGIISAWRLIFSFILWGHIALMNTPVIWWLISSVIVIFSVLAWLYANTAESYGPSSLLGFGWVIFFLPLYLHLLLERRRAKALTSGSN